MNAPVQHDFFIGNCLTADGLMKYLLCNSTRKNYILWVGMSHEISVNF